MFFVMFCVLIDYLALVQRSMRWLAAQIELFQARMLMLARILWNESTDNTTCVTYQEVFSQNHQIT